MDRIFRVVKFIPIILFILSEFVHSLGM